MTKWAYCIGRTFYSRAWGWYFLSFFVLNALFIVLYLGCEWILGVLWPALDARVVIQLSVPLSLLMFSLIVSVRVAQSRVNVNTKDRHLTLSIGSDVVSEFNIEDSVIEFVEKRIAAAKVYNMYLSSGNERFYVGNSVRTSNAYQMLRDLERMKTTEVQSGKFEVQTILFAWRHAITFLAMAVWVIVWEVVKF